MYPHTLPAQPCCLKQEPPYSRLVKDDACVVIAGLLVILSSQGGPAPGGSTLRLMLHKADHVDALRAVTPFDILGLQDVHMSAMYRHQS